MDLLSIVEQNPDLSWQSLIGNIKTDSETDNSLVTIADDDKLTETVIKKEDDN